MECVFVSGFCVIFPFRSLFFAFASPGIDPFLPFLFSCVVFLFCCRYYAYTLSPLPLPYQFNHSLACRPSFSILFSAFFSFLSPLSWLFSHTSQTTPHHHTHSTRLFPLRGRSSSIASIITQIKYHSLFLPSPLPPSLSHSFLRITLLVSPPVH